MHHSSAPSPGSDSLSIPWRADRRGLSLVKVPIVLTDRQAGTATMSTRIVVEALRMVWRWADAVTPPRPALTAR